MPGVTVCRLAGIYWLGLLLSLPAQIFNAIHMAFSFQPDWYSDILLFVFLLNGVGACVLMFWPGPVATALNLSGGGVSSANHAPAYRAGILFLGASLVALNLSAVVELFSQLATHPYISISTAAHLAGRYSMPLILTAGGALLLFCPPKIMHWLQAIPDGHTVKAE